MNHTALYDIHRQLGAKLVEFAGWMMPVQYSGIREEHLAVRKRAGLFDVSHMGEVEIRGKEAASLCQRIATNDVGKLREFQAQYSLFCNPRGGVVDDVIMYKFSDEHFLICVNAANTAKDYEWIINNKNGFAVEVTNKSFEFSQIALQGPSSQDILNTTLKDDFSGLKKFSFRLSNWNQIELIIARTGYTGEDGFEIFLPWGNAPELWKEILEKGKQFGIHPCGLGARDTLRIEMGYPLYGHEIDEDTNPLEAGLGRFIKLDKGYFVGKEAIVQVIETGLRRKLHGFEMIDRGIPRQGYNILNDEILLGTVTSGTMSPSLDKPIGMAYIRTDVEFGTEIQVEIRGARRKAEIVSLPFIKKKD
ncbi:MAG TPA: glycine cleavage system aminomethyltransferase GcvT [Thermodesulfobacteriota bacterium]|nr:glycine cleavage system aminomethyltransferase GcvT [Thermodesulfobacteriota bacterium]